MRVKILLADDHKIMRGTLRALLEKQDGMDVVAEAENGRDAVMLSREHRPDVVIMDVNMADLPGTEVTRRIISDFPEVKVIGLSMYSNSQFVTGMFKAGATGYLLKDCAFEELARAIRTVSDNQTYLSPKITGIVIKDYVEQGLPDGLLDSQNLTVREREVLQLITEGLRTRQIADHLNVSVKTIETHRRKIMEKLDIRSIAELTKYAIREGLTSLNT